MASQVLGEVINQLKSAFVVEVWVATINANRKLICEFHVRHGTDGGEIVGTMRILHPQLVYQRRTDRAGKVAYKGAVSIVVVLETGRHSEAIVQRRVIDQVPVIVEVAHVHIVRLVDGMIQPQQHIVVVGIAGHVQVVDGEIEPPFEVLDRSDVVEDDRIVIRRLAPALTFVVGEEEGPALHDGSTQSKAELVLAELVEFLAAARGQVSGNCAGRRVRRSQDTACIQRVMAEVFVGRTVEGIRPAFGDDVDDAAYSTSELSAVAAVDDAEFAYRLLRGRVLLHARSSRDIVRATTRDKVVVNVLTGERQRGHGLDNDIGAAGSSVADLHTGSQQGEVDELPSIYRQILNLLLVDDTADHGTGWLG